MENITAYITGLMDEQVEALLRGDEELFLKRVLVNGYDKYYLQKWFQGYAVQKASPIKCDYQIIHVDHLGNDTYNVNIILNVFYLEYDNEEISILYSVKYDSEADNILIIKAEISIKDDVFDCVEEESSGLKEEDFRIYNKSGNEESWNQSELLEIIRHSKEDISPMIYARAIKKSVRFRNTHSEIDSAHVLSDIMSLKVQKIAEKIHGNSLEDTIKKLMNTVKNSVVSKSYSDLNDDISIRELSLLEQFSFDENLDFQKDGAIPMSCVELCSFYMCVLLLAGIDIKDIYVLTQPFHYLLLFKYENDFYIINSSEILKMSSTRIYMGTEVTRIFNPFLYLDENTTDMNENILETIVKRISKAVPIFELPHNRNQNTLIESDDLFDFNGEMKNGAERFHTCFLKYVFLMAEKYRDSVFTWAKYSYQSLYVCHPQAYFLSSVKDTKVQKFAESINTIQDLINYVFYEIDDESIFLEAGRVMMPRQVLDHKKGLSKDKALLMAVTIHVKKLSDEVAIVYSDKGDYVWIKSSDGVRKIYDIGRKEKVPEIDGDVLLAWNNTNLYSRFIDGERNEKWLSEITDK